MVRRWYRVGLALAMRNGHASQADSRHQKGDSEESPILIFNGFYPFPLIAQPVDRLAVHRIVHAGPPHSTAKVVGYGKVERSGLAQCSGYRIAISGYFGAYAVGCRQVSHSRAKPEPPVEEPAY